jgi:nucleoside-diphosphate-sugar epimerase
MSLSQKLPESVFIFGCGYVGTALAEYLIEQGVRVGALTRNVEKAARLRELGPVEVIEAQLDSSTWHAQVRGQYEAVVNCVSSAGGGLDGYRKSYVDGQCSILEWAKSQTIRTYVYTSSTSVYPQDGGVTVDESADTSAAPPTGQVLLQSEAMLADAEQMDRWFVLRLAGIYGQGRHFLLNQLREANGEIPGSGEYAMNMIHLEDIVSAISAALSGEAASGIYNIVDDAPVTKSEVLTWLAEGMGLPVPAFNPDKVSERLKRRGGRMPHRYVSNAKARAQLGWQPKYPSYRDGYAGWLS